MEALYVLIRSDLLTRCFRPFGRHSQHPSLNTYLLVVVGGGGVVVVVVCCCCCSHINSQIKKSVVTQRCWSPIVTRIRKKQPGTKFGYVKEARSIRTRT